MRVCLTCTSPHRVAIDEALATGKATKRGLSRLYGVSEDSLHRHEARHLPESLVVAAETSKATQATRLLTRVDRMASRLESALDRADESRHDESLLKVSRELRPSLELLGRVSGEIANDRVNALFLMLGVSGEGELKQAIDLKRSIGDSVSPDNALDEIEAAIRMALPQARHRITSLRTVLDEIEGMSYAVEVNGNGHKQ